MIPRLKSVVKQEQKFGCTIACIATILQKDYWEIAKHFSTNLNEEGLTTKQIWEYLSSEGINLAILQQLCWDNREINNKRMLVPFADIHIISVKTASDKEIEHAMIMDKFGNIFCSRDRNRVDTRELYLVTENMGIWYPRNWQFKKERKK